MAGQSANIVLNNLSVGYHSKNDKKTLLSSVNIQLICGEIIALMGVNGSGKSTLLRTLAGFQRPLSGEVLLNSGNLFEYSVRDRARFISYVSTEPVRVGNMTVLDLVGLGRYIYTGWWGSFSAEDLRAIDHCLYLTGLKGFEHRQLNSLSDGERQRVMIGRALAQNTPVIVLDEPTAFLDVRNKYEIIHLLREMAWSERKSVIFSTHDFSVSMSVADKIWLINNGDMVEGAPEDLAMNNQFQSLFTDSPVAFHSGTGEIIFSEKPVKGINLNANGKIKVWLLKSMERMGLYHDPDSKIKLKAEIRDQNIIYLLEKPDEILEFSSIYELFRDDFFRKT
jgi:iron complex transport system ATP-binding protein